MAVERLTLALIAAQSLVLGGSCLAAATINEWVAQHTSDGQKVLCAVEKNGEYFFLAKSDQDYRLGSLIDVTGSSRPKTYLQAWRFVDENGRSLSVKKRPVPIAGGYRREGTKIYAEHVEQQALRPSDSLNVRVDIKKCPSAQCEREISREGEVSYVVDVCTLRLPP
jgi:hypothetical protein